MNQSADFPKYLIKINDEQRFLSFREALGAHNSAFSRGDFGEYILNEDFSVRKMTSDDKSRILIASDRCHEGK